MKRLGRFFSLALLTLIVFTTMAVQCFAATDASFDFAAFFKSWGAGIVIVGAILIVAIIVIIIKLATRKKPAPKVEAVKEPEIKEPEVKAAPKAKSEPKQAPKADVTPVGEQITLIEEVKPEPTCEFEELSDNYTIDAKELPAEAVDPETGCTYTFDENGIPVPPEGKVIRYKWSFLGRLSQAHPEVKYHYLTLRRTLLAYAKMRSNISWNFDSYFVGRRTIAKLKIRGKNLVVYFPIDPKEMEGTKYVGEDASKVSRYKAVPFAYAINGTRKLKYAIELIEKLMESKPTNAPVLVDEADVNVYVPERDFNTLYNRELIRIGGFLSVGAKAQADEDEE